MTTALGDEIDRLRAELEAHEIIRDACFTALPECKTWAEVPWHINRLREVNAALVDALQAMLKIAKSQ